MRNGHNLEIYVIPMLKNLGYKEKDIHRISNQSSTPYPNPDYIIREKGIRIAVEVGTLSRKTKIKDLLVNYEKVIWIFSDKDLPFLNCIIYKRGELEKSEKDDMIRERYENEIKDLKVQLENNKKSLENLRYRLVTRDNKIKATKSILEADEYRDNVKLDFSIKEILIREIEVNKDKEEIELFGFIDNVKTKIIDKPNKYNLIYGKREYEDIDENIRYS